MIKHIYVHDHRAPRKTKDAGTPVNRSPMNGFKKGDKLIHKMFVSTPGPKRFFTVVQPYDDGTILVSSAGGHLLMREDVFTETRA